MKEILQNIRKIKWKGFMLNVSLQAFINTEITIKYFMQILIPGNFGTNLQRLEILIYYSLQTSGTPNTDQLFN